MSKRTKKSIIIAVASLLIIEIIAFSIVSFQYDFKQAKKYYEKGEYSKSASLCLNLIERGTNGNSEIYALCADSYIAAGDYKSALEILQSAVGNVLDESKITDKMNQIQPADTSKLLELTQDYETFNDKGIIPFLIIFLATLCVFLIIIIYDRKKQRQKVLEIIMGMNQKPKGSEKIEEIEMKTHIKISSDCYDPILDDAITTVIMNGYASASLLQRKHSIGYAKAAKIIDTMESIGIIGPYEGSKPRKVLVGKDFLNSYCFEIQEAEKKDSLSDYEFEWFIANCNRYVENKDYIESSDNSCPTFNIEKTEKSNYESATNAPSQVDATEAETNPTVLTLQDILNRVDKMSENGWEFERFVASLLLKNGFSSTQVTSGSNDYGVDVIAIDSLGVRYAIQCKCYSNKLNNKSVQEVIAGKAMYNCQVGVVCTNNFFTDNATEVARGNNILLWDRNRLIELINNVIKDISANFFDN